MASSKDLTELKTLLQSLHQKVDALSVELNGLRTQAGGLESTVTDNQSPASIGEPSSDTPEGPQGPEPNAARDVVFDFVAAALIVHDQKCWDLLEGLTHSGSLLAPRSLDHLKAFSWKKLRTNARRYFQEKSEITAARIEPEVIQESTQSVKVFVAHGKGASSPVTVARDSEAGGDWRVQSCSL